MESLRESPLRNALPGHLALHRGRSTEATARLDPAWELVDVDREPSVAAKFCQRFVLDHLARGHGRELVDLPPADELTPQERSVAALVAGGMSNREVATELYLSVKTVQYHLTRIYAKLGLRSRTELAARWEDTDRTVGS